MISEALNGPALALTMGAGFVARGFSGNVAHLSGLIQAAVQYKGFSVIDIFQPCVTFNRVNTAQWYKDRIYELDNTESRDDFQKALKLAFETGDRIPVGILYARKKQEFISQIKGLEKGPLIDRPYDPDKLKKTAQDFIFVIKNQRKEKYNGRFNQCHRTWNKRICRSKRASITANKLSGTACRAAV